MSDPLWGVVAGVVFGTVAVGMLLPMSFPDKRAALLGAFADRFSIGMVIGGLIHGWGGAA